MRYTILGHVKASEKNSDDDELVRIPIDGTLDLHHFKTNEIADLVVEYLRECRRQGITTVRLIHGKGTGALRETVHAVLRKHQEVQSFRMADATGGGWGATLVTIKP
jgi:dsDNA-specific endonuclease/ATPase MutS2